MINRKQIDIYISVHKGIRHLIGRLSFMAGAADWEDAEKAERMQAVLSEEIFGPLLHVMPHVSNLDETIATTNNTAARQSHAGDRIRRDELDGRGSTMRSG